MRHAERPSRRLRLRMIAAQRLGQAGMQREHAVQAGEAKNPQDQAFGADQGDGTIVVLAPQAPPGAHQHAKAHRIHEAHLAKIDHQLSAAGLDRLVQAGAQLRRAGDVDLATNLHDGRATRAGHAQIQEQSVLFSKTRGHGVCQRHGRCADVCVALPGQYRRVACGAASSAGRAPPASWWGRCGSRLVHLASGQRGWPYQCRQHDNNWCRP
jgi:hypothetical protein